jgi:hypothetical protein
MNVLHALIELGTTGRRLWTIRSGPVSITSSSEQGRLVYYVRMPGRGARLSPSYPDVAEDAMSTSRHESLPSALAEIWVEDYGDELFDSDEWEIPDD